MTAQLAGRHDGAMDGRGLGSPAEVKCDALLHTLMSAPPPVRKPVFAPKPKKPPSKVMPVVKFLFKLPFVILWDTLWLAWKLAGLALALPYTVPKYAIRLSRLLKQTWISGWAVGYGSAQLAVRLPMLMEAVHLTLGAVSLVRQLLWRNALLLLAYTIALPRLTVTGLWAGRRWLHWGYAAVGRVWCVVSGVVTGLLGYQCPAKSCGVLNGCLSNVFS